jgi:hypothetical protein
VFSAHLLIVRELRLPFQRTAWGLRLFAQHGAGACRVKGEMLVSVLRVAVYRLPAVVTLGHVWALFAISSGLDSTARSLSPVRYYMYGYLLLYMAVSS